MSAPILSRIEVSIIIPVYNVQSYLFGCIDSVISQSYENIEVILIDDGSTDKSAVICERFAKKDKRVRLFRKKNSGSSDARNMGIDLAKGNYLMFVDSDDLLHKDIVKNLLHLIKINECSISVCDFIKIKSHEDLPVRKDNISVCIKNNQDALSDLLYSKIITNSPCAKLYEKKLFQGIRYQSGKINQDLGTTYKLFAKASKVAVTSDILYYYFQREGSITNSPFTERRMAGLDFAYEELEFIEEHYPLLINAARNRLFIEAVSIGLAIGKSNIAKHRESWIKCRNVIKKYKWVVAFDLQSGLGRRAYAIAAFLSPTLIFTISYIKRGIHIMHERLILKRQP